MKILLTGGTGRLGRELQQLRSYAYAPTHEEMDLGRFSSAVDYMGKVDADLIVHAAAYTRVEKAEHEAYKCWSANVEGTKDLTLWGIPILYISTEYVFDGEKGLYTEADEPNPINFYAVTKYNGEKQLSGKDKILRMIFKPRPFPYDKAFCDQWTSGDYVDVMAKEVDKAITLFEHLPHVVHLGTGRKTVLELAARTRNIGFCSRDTATCRLPRDCSLDTSLWTRIKQEHKL